MRKIAPAIALVIATFVAIYVGTAQIDSFWSALFAPGSNEILWQIRIPRVTAALIVGASLALAGLLAQGVCNNALAEPSILGTTAGASLGTVLAVITGLAQVGSIGAIVCGAAGALAATSLTFKLANLRAHLSSFAFHLSIAALSTDRNCSHCYSIIAQKIHLTSLRCFGAENKCCALKVHRRETERSDSYLKYFLLRYRRL